jgi:hypothetical protein
MIVFSASKMIAIVQQHSLKFRSVATKFVRRGVVGSWEHSLESKRMFPKLCWLR